MKQIQWNYADKRRVFRTDTHAAAPFLSFRVLEEMGFVVNGFSTRLGGASTGKFFHDEFFLTAEAMIRSMCWKTLRGWRMLLV